jgi:hypothetical protein
MAKSTDSNITVWRRQALSLAAQLPEDREDALEVLNALTELIEHVYPTEKPNRPTVVLLQLVQLPCGACALHRP